MQRILLLGKNGQIAWELRRALAVQAEVITLGSQDLNLENSMAIREAVRNINPRVIVNAAAFTAVDQAEDEPEKARLINAVAPGIIAEEAKRSRALLVHYSTDYVFDGSKESPYTEDDRAEPINVYGKTKLEGENNIRDVDASHLIFRTCWVYGMRGRNFLLAMLKLAREKDELRVVDDQYGSPTWSRMIAQATALILFCSSHLELEGNITGTYHLSARGQTTWYEFARTIFELYFTSENDYANVIPIPSDEFITRAKRPANSVLSADKLEKEFGISLPWWYSSLAQVMER